MFGCHPRHQAHGADHDRRRHRPRSPEHDDSRMSRVREGRGRLLPVRPLQHAHVRRELSGGVHPLQRVSGAPDSQGEDQCQGF